VYVQADEALLRLNRAVVFQASILLLSRVRARLGAAVPHADTSRPSSLPGSQVPAGGTVGPSASTYSPPPT
jgi:hypothetical protein